MKCPACNLDLLMGERLTVPIDYCPKCRGIRRTDGRLENLLERSGADRDPKARNRQDNGDDERGIGGFLKGIFD